MNSRKIIMSSNIMGGSTLTGEQILDHIESNLYHLSALQLIRLSDLISFELLDREVDGNTYDEETNRPL